MRARIHDPVGPPYGRGILPAIIAILIACVAGVMVSGRLWYPAAALSAFLIALIHAYAAQRPQFAPRDATLRVGPGFIDVEGAREVSGRLTARDLVGASAAPVRDGASLVLVHRGRKDSPIAVDVDGIENARAVRRALGIGEHGFGVVRWETGPHALDRACRAILVAGTLLWGSAGALCLVAALAAGSQALTFSAIGCAGLALLFTLSAVVFAAFGSKLRAPGVELRRDALVVSARSGEVRLGYDEIAGASVVSGGIHVARRDGQPPLAIAMRRHQDRIAVHIGARAESGASRASGVGALLARGGEPIARWRVRLDEMAPALHGTTSYRMAPLDAEALWRTLEDPEAPGDDRAAAARLLTRDGTRERRARVDDAIASMRDEDAVKMVRLLLDSDDEDVSALGASAA